MAAPIIIARVTQFCNIKSFVRANERIISWTIHRRTYYEHNYESDIHEEQADVLRMWNSLKNTFGASPLKEEPWSKEEWTPKSKRCSVLAVKLGMVPIWTKSGDRLTATVLQVLENNVLKYIPPGTNQMNTKYGSIIIGARNADPLKKSLEYSEIFKEAKTPVKDKVVSCNISANARIQPGTPLLAGHFRPGMHVDCRGKTIDKGFQGVMKRWGMKGQPASHGATKTHRKMGASGGGGSPGRVWPGKKMPGQMGDKWRWTKGLKVWRVNTKYNLIYVGGCLAGPKLGYVKVMDSTLPQHRVMEIAPPFPTYYEDEKLDEDLYDVDMFQHDERSIEYEIEEEEI